MRKVCVIPRNEKSHAGFDTDWQFNPLKNNIAIPYYNQKRHPTIHQFEQVLCLTE